MHEKTPTKRWYFKRVRSSSCWLSLKTLPNCWTPTVICCFWLSWLYIRERFSIQGPCWPLTVSPFILSIKLKSTEIYDDEFLKLSFSYVHLRMASWQTLFSWLNNLSIFLPQHLLTKNKDKKTKTFFFVGEV
jgi:hypothetical protein